jgi:hypothetical protein
MHRRHLLKTLAGGAVALASGSARAQSVESFYKGKTITLFVATSPGGNYDLNGRLVSRHLGRFIPGNPSIVVQNVPGAGGLLMANRLANTIERDGLTIAIMERGTPQTAYEGDVNARFDPLTLTWLGSLSSYATDSYLLLVNDKNPATLTLPAVTLPETAISVDTNTLDTIKLPTIVLSPAIKLLLVIAKLPMVLFAASKLPTVAISNIKLLPTILPVTVRSPMVPLSAIKLLIVPVLVTRILLVAILLADHPRAQVTFSVFNPPVLVVVI